MLVGRECSMARQGEATVVRLQKSRVREDGSVRTQTLRS